MKHQRSPLLPISILVLSAVVSNAAVTINFGTFASPIGNSTSSLSATDGDDISIVTSGTLGETGLTIESTGANLGTTAISSTYNDWVSFTFETSTTVSIDSTSFFYDFVNGNRGNRFTQVSVFKYDNLVDLNIQDSVTLAEVNTGDTDNATITSAAGAYSALDAGSAFEVRFALKSSETWGDQDMDNLSVTFSPIPEPSSVALVFGGLGLLAMRRRR